MSGCRMRLLERFEHQTGDRASFSISGRRCFSACRRCTFVCWKHRPRTAREIGRHDAAVRLGLGAAAGAGARGVSRAVRPHHSRTLRHDRDDDEHLESVCRASGGRATVGFPAAGRFGADRRESGELWVKGPQRVRGLLAARRRDTRCVRATAGSRPGDIATVPRTATTRCAAAGAI